MERLSEYIDDVTSTPNIDKKLYSADEEKLHHKVVDRFHTDKAKAAERITIDRVLKLHQEALYNLQFFNPYLKRLPAYQYADL